MKIDLGTIRSDSAGFKAIADIAVKAKEIRQESITLDFSSCQFFEANMSAPLYAVISRLRDANNDVTIENVPGAISNILRKNRFLTHFNRAEQTDSYQTTLPFRIFKDTEELFHEYITNYMQGKGIPDMSLALAKRFRQSLLELFLNAVLHSESKSGIFVCGQYYPNKQRLDFTIADAGIGIPENVRRYTRTQISACDAIQWALQEGNTTKTGNQPGGLGLKLIKDFININKGIIHIVSQSGYYTFSAIEESIQDMQLDFSGTCINIEINTADTSSYCLQSELTNEDIF
ncbi:ATP-binding protein [Desulfovibrio sp. ZJ369]|uniref:ATP-binding protein n=1 Tax=Desulfovibrio sp. ZJ369 TaxID=2709793 RepID=UPI0013EA27B8|nr:ATP-binding protein [Desulfovibrio sp. ZJ369]